MPDPVDVAKRIFVSYMHLNARLGRAAKLEELGKWIGDARGTDAPDKGTVSRWATGEQKPDLATIEAIAAVCGVDPGWIAFGEKTGAPAPPSAAAMQAQFIPPGKKKKKRRGGEG